MNHSMIAPRLAAWRSRCRVVLLATAGLLATALPALAVDGDVEPDGKVDLRDLIRIRNRLGQTGPPGWLGEDLTADGTIDFGDVLRWRQFFPLLAPVGPYVFVASPLDGSVIGDRRPVVVIDFGPDGVPVNPASFQLKVDGQLRTADAVVSGTNAALLLNADLADGPHSVEASLSDTNGGVTVTLSNFEVTSLKLLPEALPATGPAPLTVTFFPGVIYADSPPAYYSWDFTDDGTYDIVDPRPDSRTFTYTQEGTYTVRYRVTRSDGTTASTTLPVHVAQSYASVSPSNGKAPLSVFLHGITVDPGDPITLYEWDYDFNGTFTADYSSASQASTPRIYVTPGVYHPVFRATHQSGAVTLHPVFQGELHVKAAGAPVATASAAQGANALQVNFAGSGSDDGSIVRYEWDFDNDGTWDSSSSATGLVTYTFPSAGLRVAALRVTDNDGNTSIDRVRFETRAPANLEVLDDTVVPANGETTTIRTTLTITSVVILYIRSREVTSSPGRIVRTLVDHVERPPGTYDDLWDGRDDRGQPLHPGAFFAVLQYAYPGRTEVLDVARTTGEVHYFAAKIPPEVTTFDMMADNPLPMRFRITKASRASLYILPGGTDRTDTMFDNLALGAGDYTYYWAGLDENGQFAPPNIYLWTVNGWTFGDNAIVVSGQPAIDNLQISPNLLSPTSRPLGTATAQIQFDLNVPASVFVNIFNMDNNRNLRSFRLADLPAGTASFTWDGKTESGLYVSPGYYRVSLLAIDAFGNVSIEREGIMDVEY